MADEEQLQQLREIVGDMVEDAAFSEDQIKFACVCAYAEVTTYTRRSLLDDALMVIAAQIAVIKLNRLGSEGAASVTYSGAGESYVDGYPANIRAALNMRRKLKAL